jgi:2,4-dienoyl-CoA reductase-like NADH-dependent reductase (Old Yellow Enzyme family)/thioredoxin reductase
VSSLFEHLFTPLELGPVELRNRIYVTPHSTMFVSDEHDNLPGVRLATYCAERAKGGVGLIEVSMATVSPEVTSYSGSTDAQFSPLFGGLPESMAGRFPIDGCNPRVVEGYSKLARAVHAHGAKCAIEITAGGTNFGNERGVSQFPWPSISGVSPQLPFTSREMDENDIEETASGFATAAKFVRDAGLDGVDLHGAHGTLIAEFLSPAMNRRKDRWGGSVENRMRFLFEVIREVRDAVGDDLAIGMRLMGDDGLEGGIFDDRVEIARKLDGKLDWITADMGLSPHYEDWIAVPMYISSGYNLRVTSPIKAALRKTKVGIVGRYVDPVFAEQLLTEGEADMVAMTRALIADPELPNKAREGRLEEIRPCIGVLQDCQNRTLKGLPMSCTVNPVVSREQEWGIGSLRSAPVKKKVLVIGGGPAGLETARVAAERGHHVVIYEKSREPGGQALLASKLPGRSDIRAIIGWQTAQLKKLGVETRYGLEVTPDPSLIDFVLEEEKPDAVVIATGSIPIRDGMQPYSFSRVEGWNERIVCTEVDVLEERVELGKKVIVGDTLSFIEAPGMAELLAKEGRDVEVVTWHANIGMELKTTNHWAHLLPRLFAAGVRVTPFTWIKRIAGHTVTLYNVYDERSERAVEDVDNVILITGKLQNDSLHSAFSGRVGELYLVGDANIGGARIGFAMYDAQTTGRKI